MKEILIFALIIAGCVVCHKLSTGYDAYIEDKYKEGCINWWWSVLIAILTVAVLLTIGEEKFWVFIALVLGISVLSAWLAYRKLIRWGATGKEAFLGGLAQVASAVGIAATILLFLLLVFGGSGGKKRKRK